MGELPIFAKLFSRSASKNQQDLEAMRDIADDVIESDFVPYACLFDAHTIATKNGELLQIIRLNGLDARGAQVQNLRDMLRQTIVNKIPNTNYAFWLHTIRRHQPLTPRYRYGDQFSQAVDATWRKSHALDDTYINELYITIVRAGAPTNLSSAERKKEFIRSLWPPKDMPARTGYMNEATHELNRTVDAVVAELQPYGVHRLGVVERDGIFYGEHLEFLEQLINLQSRPMPLVQEDLSEYLTSGDVTFGFNAMEVRTAEGQRRFATILTIKEYKEASLAGLDQFLEIPCELIVTQCFDFIGAAKAREEYETQAKYLGLSGDKELAQWAEINMLTKDGGHGDLAFGQQQTSLFMIAPSLKQLEANVKMVRRALTRLGILVVREDLRFEEMYWAQLPANFVFIARSYSVNTMHMGGFVKLERPPLGNRTEGPWGEPLMLFRNAQGIPKFFSFHDQQSPHVAVLGRHGAGRTSFTHLLLAHTRKWSNMRLWMIDTRGRSTPFMQAIGGDVVSLGAKAKGLNPFLQPDSDATREFLALWAANLLDAKGNNPAMLGFFKQIASTIMELPAPKRTLSSFVAALAKEDAMIAKSFAPWHGAGTFGSVLDAATDSVNLGAICSFDIQQTMHHPNLRAAVTSYLLHRMTMALDGTPTLLVLDEAFLLLDNPLFGPRLAGWLEYLTRQNVVLILVASELEGAAETGFGPVISPYIGHRFLFADADPTPDYMSQFGVIEEAYAILPEIVGPQRMIVHQEGEKLNLYRSELRNSDALREALTGVRKEVVKKSASAVLAELMGTAEATA